MADARAALLAALKAPGAPSSDYDLNGGLPQPAARPLREAAVLIAAFERAGRAEVWLTRRSAALRHHPGQVAFPGGKVEPVDGSPEAAALREAGEEIGLPAGAAAILGCLPAHETVTGFRITPVLAWIEAPFAPVPEAGEVAEVFPIPLAYLADLGAYRVRARRWRGAERRYYVLPWGPHYVWGATARICRALADRMPEAAA